MSSRREFAAGCMRSEVASVARSGGKVGVIDVDADAGDGVAVDELDEDAGDFLAVEHEVVGPAEIAGDAGGFGDGFDGGEAEGEREYGRGVEHDGAVDAVPGSECQVWPWRPCPAVCSSAMTMEPRGRLAAARMVESTVG